VSDDQPTEPSAEDLRDEAERRRREDRRSLIDLTRAERGEPERRRLPGVDRRGPDHDAPDGGTSG
jgi:hypothetical protein